MTPPFATAAPRSESDSPESNSDTALGADFSPAPNHAAWRLPGRRLPELDPAPGIDPGVGEFQTTVRRQLALLGEDVDREGLLRTPERVEKSFRWLTRGYDMRVEDAVGDAVFAEEHRNMVLVKDVEVYSLCEHHLLPFFGKAHLAYVPNGRIVGLSKLPRIVEIFARRLQVQERLTEQIAQAIEDLLHPLGVGVVIEAAHLCMMMRGVEKQGSKTITSALRGLMQDSPMARNEFLRLAVPGL